MLTFEEEKSLLSFMLFAFFAGFLAILTPCVFPMIPLTVSYFANKKNSKKSWAYSEHKGKWWVRDQKYKLYNDGKFVEVSSTKPGNEIPLNGKLNESQKAAFLVLDCARQNLTN